MAENTKRTKELTSTQEGIIAGLVLLFFGLLYWYLNPWQSEQQSMPNLAEQTATGNIQRHSLADTSPTQATSTTETGTDTSQTAATTTSPQPQTTTQAIPPTSATVPTAASATSNATMSGTAAEPVLTAAALAETTPAKPTPATTTEATAAASAGSPTSSPVDTPNTAPDSSTPSAAASPSTQTTAETTASESKAAEASTNATQTTDIVAAKPADTTTTTTTAAKPEPVQPTTTNMVNKLELAPGSPEAKLQSYLEKKTLETPVSMDGINFEAKTAKLTKESDAAVLLLAALLAQYPEANFLITSYTTETGNENQNSDELSLIRAQTLGENLVKAGVNGKRITIMGMGKRPSPDPTSVASKKSQHIEISVIQ
ncbi:MAG: hypothetical protein RLZZ215_3157 [Pseudomonadota bacterium]|jgi:outer membrane protein OmpA-like peptidoglycan-associated protein